MCQMFQQALANGLIISIRRKSHFSLCDKHLWLTCLLCWSSSKPMARSNNVRKFAGYYFHWRKRTKKKRLFLFRGRLIDVLRHEQLEVWICQPWSALSPWKNELGTGADGSPAGADIFAVTLQTVTGCGSPTDRGNLWKWKQTVKTDGSWSLSVPCSNQVKPCRAEFKANVPYKSPGFPGPPNEN